VKNISIVTSQNLCAYSAALIADAQAAVMRAQRAVHRADDACKAAKKQRAFLVRVHANYLTDEG
jgi:hypothetical protein